MPRTAKRRKTGERSPHEEEGEPVTEEFLRINSKEVQEAESTDRPQTRRKTGSRGGDKGANGKSTASEEPEEKEDASDEEKEIIEQPPSLFLSAAKTRQQFPLPVAGIDSPQVADDEPVTEEFLGVDPEKAKEEALRSEPPETRQATRNRSKRTEDNEKASSNGKTEEDKRARGASNRHPASEAVTAEPKMVTPEFSKPLVGLEDILNAADKQVPFFASRFSDAISSDEIPKYGFPARYCSSEIKTQHALDYNELLNASSFVNVVSEVEEEEVVTIGTKTNLADQSVYPQSIKMLHKVINMIARLWNCPLTDEIAAQQVFPGEACIGSSEACLLAGLALKLRWRKWYRNKYGLSEEDAIGVRPNLITSSLHHSCWEQFFKYFDVYPKLITPSLSKFKLDTNKIEELVDDKTIGILCILGNHYAGQYDEIHVVNALVDKINRKKGYQVGIHVDAATGGFIAPFRKDVPPWDFRLENVLSINASG